MGIAADVIVFDFEKFTDKATFAQPHAEAEGMKYVLVNGELVWDDGKPTKAQTGPSVTRSGLQRPAVVNDQPRRIPPPRLTLG